MLTHVKSILGLSARNSNVSTEQHFPGVPFVTIFATIVTSFVSLYLIYRWLKKQPREIPEQVVRGEVVVTNNSLPIGTKFANESLVDPDKPTIILHNVEPSDHTDAPLVKPDRPISILHDVEPDRPITILHDVEPREDSESLDARCAIHLTINMSADRILAIKRIVSEALNTYVELDNWRLDILLRFLPVEQSKCSGGSMLPVLTDMELTKALGDSWFCVTPNEKEKHWPRNYSDLQKEYICLSMDDQPVELFRVW